MPLRKSDRQHKERVVYDDEPYYGDDYNDRPRASRRVSRSAHELDSADAGRAYRRRSRYEEDISPPRPSTRSRSLGHRPPPRGRYDSYDSYSDYSDSDDDRRRRRNRSRGGGGRRQDSKVSGASSRTRMQRRETHKANIIQAAASAAVVAGAAEAWHLRKDKRPWSKKGTKVATAAAGAAAIAAFKGDNPKEHGSKKSAIEATLGGLVLNRLANGRK